MLVNGNLLSFLNFKIIIFSYKNNLNIIYLHNKSYFIKIPVNIFNIFIFYNNQSNNIFIFNFFFYNFFYNKILNNFQKLNFRFLFFKGRGFRYRVSKNNFLLLLGYSHMLYMNISNFFFKIISKTSILFINYSLVLNLNNILKYKKLNIFTNKGLITNKINIFKKTGKVSFYL